MTGTFDGSGVSEKSGLNASYDSYWISKIPAVSSAVSAHGLSGRIISLPLQTTKESRKDEKYRCFSPESRYDLFVAGFNHAGMQHFGKELRALLKDSE